MDVSIVPSNCGAHFPVKLGTGLKTVKEYLPRITELGIIVEIKFPNLLKNIMSSLRYQYPYISMGRFLSGKKCKIFFFVYELKAENDIGRNSTTLKM